MFYSSTDIEGDLKCAYCNQQFLDVVKLVPECGESICGHCYEDLKAKVNALDKFECRACSRWHSMPKEGLTDVGFMRRLLKKRKIDKPLSEAARELKKLVESLPDKLRELESFDEREHVNQHCDLLEVEVVEEIESLVKHLSQIETDLLEQIRDYRKERLESLSVGSKETKENGREKTRRELASLRRELDEFGAHWNDYFSRWDAFVTDCDIKAALKKTAAFEHKMSSFDRKLKSVTFGGQIMQFKASHSFFRDQEPLRNLFTLCIQKTDLRIQSTPLQTLTGHSGCVKQVLFLSDDRAVSCANESAIRVWNLRDGEQLFELNGHSSSVNTIELLANGWLASGSYDKSIKIWDLDQQKEVRTLRGHKNDVMSLKALANRNLASISSKNAIKIWNLYTDVNNLLMTIPGHDGFSWETLFDVLPNNQLVTCFRDPESRGNCILRVCNSIDGRLAQSVNTGIQKASALNVLSNGQIALGFECGTIKIVDLADEAKSRTKPEAHYFLVGCFAQLSNDRLVSAGKDVENFISFWGIKVWSLSDLSLLQTLKTCHTERITWLAISPSQDLLASSSADSTVKLWPIIASCK